MSDWKRFSHEINLTEYAASCGYELDRKNSTRASIKMRHGNDIIIVSKKGGAWVYFSVVDDTDNGNIINFIQKRTGKELSEIAKELKIWLGESALNIEPKHYVRDVKEQEYDPQRVQNVFKGCYPAQYHGYLQGRGIKQGLINSSRFKGRIYFDRYKNAAFPHENEKGEVCALELKNKDHGVFVKGSEKTFWRSHCFKTDDTLIIGEAVIDVLSYAILFQNERAIYAATGGGMSPDQSALLKKTLSKLHNLKTVILVTDNDEGGDRLAEKLKVIIEESRFKGEVMRHSPEQEGQDWNNVLKNKIA